MPLSVDELRAKVQQYRSNGLNTQQIADELSLSQTTIQWLSTEKYSNNAVSEDRPTDVQVGWRSVAVKASRIEAISYIFADIICLLYTSPSPRDVEESRMPSSA